METLKPAQDNQLQRMYCNVYNIVFNITFFFQSLQNKKKKKHWYMYYKRLSHQQIFSITDYFSYRYWTRAK